MSVHFEPPTKGVESVELIKRTHSNAIPHAAKTPRGIRRREKKHGKSQPA
jgi:hypothetical protein